MPEALCPDCGKRMFHENEDTLKVEESIHSKFCRKKEGATIVICIGKKASRNRWIQKEILMVLESQCSKDNFFNYIGFLLLKRLKADGI